MRILLFVGTVDFVLSLIGYLYYRHTLPIGRTPAFGLLYLLLALGAAVSVILPQGTPTPAPATTSTWQATRIPASFFRTVS